MGIKVWEEMGSPMLSVIQVTQVLSERALRGWLAWLLI